LLFFPQELVEVASSFVWEWETPTLQRLGKTQALHIYIYDKLYYIPIYRAMFSQDHLTCFLPGTLALDVFHHAMERYGPRCLANQTWLAGQSPRINGYTWSFEWKNPKLTWNPQKFNSTTHLDEWKMTS